MMCFVWPSGRVTPWSCHGAGLGWLGAEQLSRSHGPLVIRELTEGIFWGSARRWECPRPGGGGGLGRGQGTGALRISKTEEVRAGACYKQGPGWALGMDTRGLMAGQEQGVRSADPGWGPSVPLGNCSSPQSLCAEDAGSL